jgi:hypothetical protein
MTRHGFLLLAFALTLAAALTANPGAPARARDDAADAATADDDSPPADDDASPDDDQSPDDDDASPDDDQSPDDDDNDFSPDEDSLPFGSSLVTSDAGCGC